MLKGENALLLLAARTALSGIRRHLPTEVPAAGVSLTAKVPFNVLCCREGLIWRAEELARCACDCFEKLDMVAGIALTRALFETAAVLWHLKETMDRQIKKGIEPDLDLQILRIILGHSNSTELPKSINVMTCIDKLTKTFPNARVKYDEMSEYAHPNWSGTAFPFSAIDREKLIVTFGRGLRGADHQGKLGLTCLLDGLKVSEEAYNDIADLMPTFTTMCEKYLLKRPIKKPRTRRGEVYGAPQWAGRST